ncbi:MAG: hypothetical protein ACJ766_01070 [Thermoleophilaceae bacterium]
MRRFSWLPIVVLFALAALPATAAGKAPTVHQVAAALDKDPVYVAPTQSGKLSPSAARSLRRLIARLDKGRIQIAVVPPASADRVGGIGPFGNAIDQAMGPDRRGALIATTAKDFQVVTSYRDVDPTLGALRHAVDTRKTLPSELRAGVQGIADVDPGPSQDINGPPQGGTATTPSSTPKPTSSPSSSGSNAGTIVAIVFGALVLLPLLGVGIWLLARWLSRRRAASQMEELDLGTVRDQLLALGQDIEDLDLDTQMPNANPNGVQEYQQGVMQYDRANRALKDKDPSQLQINEAKRAVEEGRARIVVARKLLAATPAPPSPPSS